jgi:dTMP kinase
MLTNLEKEMRDSLIIVRDDLESRAKDGQEYDGKLLLKINYAITDADLKEQKKGKTTRGRFITFEGPEGAGKSTICAELARIFDNIVLVREPGATTIGEKIRDMVHHDEMPDRSELLLFEAARACLVDTVIKPALKSGKNVLCDRFYDSTTAYQGYGRGLPIDEIQLLNEIATDGLIPDLTILFDIDPVLGMQRKGKATDRIEAAGSEFHQRVRDGYLKMAEDDKNRFIVIDACKPIDQVLENVKAIVELTINER